MEFDEELTDIEIWDCNGFDLSETDESDESESDNSDADTIIESDEEESDPIRNLVLEKVEACITNQLELWSSPNPTLSACFHLPNCKSWSNVHFSPESGLGPKPDPNEVEISVVSYANSTPKYVRMCLVLNKIHELLVNDEKVTKRGLYYQLLAQDGGSMEVVDDAIHAVTIMLQIPRRDLRILATSKGV